MERLNKNTEKKLRRSMPQIENMQSPNGNDVPNQFRIHTKQGIFFQSYNSIIAFIPYGSGKIVLDEY
jgi:hypothetical protein